MKQKRTSPFLVLICITILMASCFFVTPIIYKQIKIKEYDENFETLKTSLTQSSDYSELAYQYALDNDAMVSIVDKQTSKEFKTPSLEAIDSYKQTASTANLQIQVDYSFKGIEEINSVMLFVLPILGIILFLLSFLINGKKRLPKHAYRDLYKATEQMLAFKPDVTLPTDSKNKEKNDLSKNINELYRLLLEKDQYAKQKENDYQIILDKSKQIIQSTQKENDFQIAQILDDVKGMINNQGRYRNHAIYLMDIKVKLEELLNHDKQPQPLPTTIHDIFKTVLKPYELLASQKQINFEYQLEKNFKVSVDDLLFHQAIGHLMTFILNQCENKSTIRIVQNEFDIAIQYKGACLTEESIEKVKSIDENIKNANRYIKQLHFFMDYSQLETKDGMQFIFHF